MAFITDRQMQFIAWLITTAIDQCKTMDEVRKPNKEIRRHSAGIDAPPEDSGKQN